MNVSAFGGVSVSLADVTNTSSASTGSEFALGPGGVFIDSLAYAPSKSHFFEHDCDSDTDWILYDDRIACFFCDDSACHTFSTCSAVQLEV